VQPFLFISVQLRLFNLLILSPCHLFILWNEKKMVCRAVQILIMALCASGLTYASDAPSVAPSERPSRPNLNLRPSFAATSQPTATIVTPQPTSAVSSSPSISFTPTVAPSVAAVIITPTAAPTSDVIYVTSSSVITLAVIASIIGLIACCSGCYMFGFPAKGKDASGT
jgi:hypothetical protein